jgi:membrane protease YdiL (CAAX protease family)
MWRLGVGWYLFALLGIPAIYTIGILTVPGALASFTMPTIEWLLLPGLVGFFYIMVFGGPLFEEPGWRGFALVPLQERWGPFAGSVILGLAWAAWHLTEYTSPTFAATNGGLTAQGFGTFALVLISFSVIVTWVFNKTQGSLLLAIVLHTTLNWSQLLTSSLFPAAGTNEVGPLIAFGSMAVVVTLATRGRLGYAQGVRLNAEAAAAPA